jgi:maltoporin
MTGLDVAPEAKFWGGQRRLRIQDVHILDYFFMDYGMNYGAGMTDLNLGFAKLGVGLFNGGSDSNHNSYQNNARRANFDISGINTNEGGVLRILTTTVGGNFKYGQPGGMFSLAHNQSNFVFKGLTNSLFIQTSTGHANLQGQFEGLGDATTGGEQAGKKASRIADSINWQTGNFGGQAVVSLENWSKQGTGLTGDGVNVKDFSLGGRISYALTNNFKLLVEAANTSRTPDGAAKQTLNKITIAPTLALGKDFWSRPELRFYVTQAQWNAAAAAANAAAPDATTGLQGFGFGGKTSATMAGIQLESWF